jgi:hypothetical protein
VILPSKSLRDQWRRFSEVSIVSWIESDNISKKKHESLTV